MLTAKMPPQQQLPCGCHQVWVAPVVPMTPATYGKVIQSLGDAALAGVPLATAPGGLITAAGLTSVPATIPVVDLHPTGSPTLQEFVTIPPAQSPQVVPVPEPSSLGLVLGAIVALAAIRRRPRRGRIVAD